MALPLVPIISGAMSIIDKFIPDTNARAAAKEAISSSEFSGMLTMALQQIELNKIEAASESLWKSGWRPGAGWVCVAGLAYEFLLRPMLKYTLDILAWTWADSPAQLTTLASFPVPVSLDMAGLMTLLMGMLGLGIQRSVDKNRQRTRQAQVQKEAIKQGNSNLIEDHDFQG